MTQFCDSHLEISHQSMINIKTITSNSTVQIRHEISKLENTRKQLEAELSEMKMHSFGFPSQGKSIPPLRFND